MDLKDKGKLIFLTFFLCVVHSVGRHFHQKGQLVNSKGYGLVAQRAPQSMFPIDDDDGLPQPVRGVAVFCSGAFLLGPCCIQVLIAEALFRGYPRDQRPACHQESMRMLFFGHSVMTEKSAGAAGRPVQPACIPSTHLRLPQITLNIIRMKCIRIG